MEGEVHAEAVAEGERVEVEEVGLSIKSWERMVVKVTAYGVGKDWEVMIFFFFILLRDNEWNCL